MTFGQTVSTSKEQSLEETIMQLLASTLNKKVKTIKPDAPLFSTTSGFDSFSLMEFVLQLEEMFNIHIPDDDLDPDIFYSVKTIISYLGVRLKENK